MKKVIGLLKDKPKVRIAVIIVCIIAMVPIAITFARFVTERIRDNYLESKNFFFNSNRLKSDNPTYHINNWSGVGDFTIEIEMNSLKNSLLKSDFDVAYTTSYICPADVLCSISKNNSVIYKASSTDTFSLTITPTREFADGESITIKISATSSSPYVSTLSADFQITVGKRGISYEIDDETNRPYLLVSVTNALSYYTVNQAFDSYSVGDKIDNVVYRNLSDADKSKCSSATITLDFDPREVVLDTTSTILNGAQIQDEVIDGVSYINEITFNMNAMSSQEIRFYKLDYTKNYTYPIVNPTSIIGFSAR